MYEFVIRLERNNSLKRKRKENVNTKETWAHRHRCLILKFPVRERTSKKDVVTLEMTGKANLSVF